MKDTTYKLFFLLSFILFGSGSAFSKEVATVGGTVMDSFDSQPLPQVLVSAIQLPDSVVTNLVLTDGEGHFEIKINSENEILRFAKSGWNTVYANALSKKVNITLQREETDLPEFTVKATRASMKGKPGKFVYTPGDLVDYVKNAREVLNYVPLLESPTKIFSKTKSAVIYINGEEQMMDQSLLIEKLKTLPANKIKSIELIMNPGAGYDNNTLEGGIINIILEDDLIGWNAFTNFDAQYASRRFEWLNPRISWFYQNHNFLLSANVRYLNGNTLNSNSQLIRDDDTDLLRELTIEDTYHNNTVSGVVTGEYKFKKNYLGFSFNVSAFQSRQINTTEEKRYLDENMFDDDLFFDSSLSKMDSHIPWYMIYSTGLRFRHSFDNTFNLSISFQDVRNNQNYYNIMNIYPQGLMDEIIHSIDQSYKQKTYGDGFDIKVAKRFGDGSHLAGRVQLHHSNQQLNYTAHDDGYIFSETQWAQAFSVNYNKQWTDFFSSSLGLREEYINRNLELEDSFFESVKYRKGFLLWLPNVSLSFSLHGGLHNINLDWISKPSYPKLYELNPHKQWSNSTSYFQGNPELQITTAHDFSIQYAFLNNYFISCNYNTGKTTDSEYIYLDEDENTVSTYLPNERFNNFSLDIRYSKDLFEYRWRIRASAGLNWRNSIADLGKGGSFSNHSLDYNARIDNGVTISRRYGVEGSVAYYWSSGYRNLTIKSGFSHSLSFSLRKDLWKNADISANVYVPLNSTSSTLVTASSLSREKTHKYNRDISGSLTFSWFFGKTSIERVENITIF